MEYSPILVPVVALVAWTLIVMLWMLVSRAVEFRRLGVTSANPADRAASTWKAGPTPRRSGSPTITTI